MSRIIKSLIDQSPKEAKFKYLWELTAWDKRFNSVPKEKQPVVYDYHYFLANELKNLIVKNGDVKILTTSTTDFFTTEELVGDYFSEREVVAIPWGGNPNVQYYSGKFITGDNRIASSLDTTVLNNKYLYYFMQSKLNEIGSFYRGSGIKHPDMAKVLDLRIPVPPLEVQREIVRVLDNFTFLTAELTAELTARKKQYDYYRDVILDFKSAKEYFLSDICEIIDCPHSSPKWKDEGIPVIRNFNLIDGRIDTSRLYYVDEKEYRIRIKRVEPQENDIMFSREAPIGNVGIVPFNFRCCQGQRVVLLRPNTKIVVPRFLLHYLQCGIVRSQISGVEGKGATVSNFNISDLRCLKLRIPDLQEQTIAVQRLDIFSKVCTDIKDGLPAEIWLRKKQYAFYRDKLLLYKESTQ